MRTFTPEEFAMILRDIDAAIELATWVEAEGHGPPAGIGMYEGIGAEWILLAVEYRQAPSGKLTYDGTARREGLICRMTPAQAKRAFEKACA